MGSSPEAEDGTGDAEGVDQIGLYIGRGCRQLGKARQKLGINFGGASPIFDGVGLDGGEFAPLLDLSLVVAPYI